MKPTDNGTVTALLLLIAMSAKPPRNRLEFSHVIAQLKRFDSEQRVLALLGKPDDIWTQRDSVLYMRGEGSIWTYGSKGHLSFPLLGSVLVQEGEVRGVPPARM